MTRLLRGRTPLAWASLAVVVLAAPGLLGVTAEAAPQRARLEGRVTAPGGRPVENVRVTLLNDGYSPLKTVYTDSSGRFQYSLVAGSYYVEVEPIGLPYERYRERIEINPSPIANLGELFRVDIQLIASAKKEDPIPSGSGVRFFQDVPQKAQAEFDQGLKLLETNPDDAHARFRRALQIFPDYYMALEMLGSEYVKAGYFDHALPILLRAIDVNPDGEKSYYALGVLFYKTESYKNASKAFRRVLSTNANSPNATLYLGLALMRDKKPSEAETMLRKARDLGVKNVPDLELALATIYIDEKRYGEAADVLDRMLRENPNRSDKAKIQNLIQSLREKARRGR